MTSPTFQFEETTIEQIHAAFRAGELTARGLVEGYLARIEAYDRDGPNLNSVAATNLRVLERAEELDEAFSRTGEFSGPLHGIPVVLKDCIETEDVATTFGSEVFAGYQPREDATVVKKLREAGAIVLGKTTLPDFATSWWAYSSGSGETKNPYALDRDPGGSSSGTGAAVAANLGAVGLGTDCGGSIRLPASFDNLVGVRSTPGLVSRAGVGCLVFFQDTIGPMARTVRDAAAVMDALVGYDAADPLTAAYAVARAPKSYLEHLDADHGLAGARLGLVTNVLGPDDDPLTAPVNRIVAAAADDLRAAGAEVVEVEIPDLAYHLEATSLYVLRTRYDIDTFLAERPDAPARTLREIYDNGRYHPMLDLLEACAEGPENPENDPEYYRTLHAREEFTRAFVNLMAQNRLEALVYPSVQLAPPTREVLDSGKWTTLTFPTNTLVSSQTWTPAITVPAGFTEDGLPVGLEFVAKPYDEPTAFRIAHAFERATEHRRPPASTPELPARI